MSVRRLTRAWGGVLVLAAAHALHAANFPGEHWEEADPGALGLHAAELAQARDCALTGGGSGCIIFKGKRVLSWGKAAVRT